ncbi:MAG: DMT family transporter [Caldilinea sp.]|nr:EamA family transporter [Caldilineaceae bacterium]MCB9121707.1 EamA family transporter [Caldilineaceae bacterium]MCB9125626.1 EamA family transporter [Caldilineaceae bacterium]MCO5211204.1 DMT family transporter [Caldilinea sp.]MCW5845277.1 EamA family transporter [Caldilinea sp.]
MTNRVEPIVIAPPAPAPVKFGTIDLALIMMTVIWGMNAVIVKLTYTQIPPMAFMAVRFVIAGALLLIILRVTEGSLRVDRRDWPKFLVAGMVGTGLYQPLFLTGLSMTSASVTALIIATSPIFVALINRVLGREILPPRGWLGIALTFAGIILIVAASGGVTLSSQSFVGDMLILAGSFLWALYAVLAAPLMARYSPLRVTALTTSIGAAPIIVIGLPATLALDWSQVDLWGWSGLIYSALFAIVVGYIIWNNGVKKIGGTRTALYGNLIPVIGVITATLLLGEQLTPLKIAGAAVIFVGLHLARTAKAR